MSDILAPLLAALRDLIAWLQEKKVPGIIIGGVAVSLLSRPRLTRDVDAVVLLDSEKWEGFLKAGRQFGFTPRLQDCLAFAQKNRVLLINHKPTGIDVDISMGALPFEEEAVSRAVKTKVSGITIPLPAPEDLVIMKAVAHRPIDLADIRSILEAHPNLDLHRVRKWAKEFSSVLEMPEIFDDLKKILTQQKNN